MSYDAQNIKVPSACTGKSLHQLTHNMTTDCSLNYRENTSLDHVLPMFCACSFHGNYMNNLLSYCGLVDARISASEKVLPVTVTLVFYYLF